MNELEQRLTPVPRMAGLDTAMVDAVGDNDSQQNADPPVEGAFDLMTIQGENQDAGQRRCRSGPVNYPAETPK